MTEKQYWLRVRGPIFLMMLGGLLWGIIKIQLGPHREIFWRFLWEAIKINAWATLVLTALFALLLVPAAWCKEKRRRSTDNITQ